MIPELTVTVGQRDEQFTGTDHHPFRDAVRYLVETAGGGTVQVGPGRYEFRGAVHLSSHVRMVGAGEDTVLAKASSVSTAIARDSDWWDDWLLLEDGSGFDSGSDMVLRGTDPHHKRPLCKAYTIAERDGDRIRVDAQFDESIWHEGDFTAATLHSMIRGEHVQDVEIRDLVIDGRRDQNESLNGNYGAGIFMQRCRDVRVEDVIVGDYNGDAMSMQVVDDLVVRGCRLVNNTGLGLHPGSGSQRPVMEDNVVEGGGVGLFFCWGVQNGVARGNVIRGSETGVSIGYKDSDNLVESNRIEGTSGCGLLFREQSERARSPHNLAFRGNTLQNCGGGEFPVAHVQGPVDGTVLSGNEFRELRQDVAPGTAIRIEPGVGRVELDGNEFEGFAVEIEDGRRE